MTFVLVLLLGVPTFMSLTAGGSEEQVEVARAGMVGPALTTRVPASIPEVQAKMTPALSQLAKYDLSCAKKMHEAMDVPGEFVQFTGKSCLRDVKASNLEILNKSNGYSASIFYKGGEVYQTDLIQLQKGNNQIVIRYRDHSGKTAEELIVVRYK